MVVVPVEEQHVHRFARQCSSCGDAGKPSPHDDDTSTPGQRRTCFPRRTVAVRSNLGVSPGCQLVADRKRSRTGGRAAFTLGQARSPGRPARSRRTRMQV